MNLFDLAAKISLDSSEYEKGLSTAERDTQNFGSKIGGALSTAAKIGGAAIAAGIAGATALVKTSVDGYSEFEQLVGGVETLFGGSAQQVLDDASNAFKTAGMSMNDYMETSIQSAAALINSLGGDQAQAAQLMNVSITDMADNVNKMGTSMEAVQNAYRGFSRGNFTMLDNLALGFAGTKEGMQELLDKAQDLSGMEFDISSYSDIVQAIHIVQEEMGIAGTTALEASETISGSASSMSAAWQNLVTGLSDDTADMDKLINDFVDSAVTAADNLVPVIETALTGLGTLVEKLAPIISERLPSFIQTVLPSLISAALSLINGLIAALPTILSILTAQAPRIISTIITALTENLPMIIQAGFDLVVSLINGIVSALPELIPMAIELVFAIVDAIIANLPSILDAALQLVIALAQGIIDAIPDLLDRLPELIDSLLEFFLESIPTIIDAGIQLLTALVGALPTIISKIVEVLPKIIDGIITALLANLPLIIQSGIDLITALIEDLPTIITTIVQAIPDIIFAIVDAVIEHIPDIIDAGVSLLMSLVENLPDIIVGIVTAIGKVLSAVMEAIGRYFSKFASSGETLVKKIAEGIEKVKAWFAERWGNFISDAKEKFTNLVDGAKNWGKDMIQNFVNGITEKFRQLKQSIVNVANTVKNVLGFSVPKEGPLHDADTYMPDMMELFASGIDKNRNLVLNAAEDLAEGIEDASMPNVGIFGSKGTTSGMPNTAGMVFNVQITVPESVASDRERVEWMARELESLMTRRNAYAV